MNPLGLARVREDFLNFRIIIVVRSIFPPIRHVKALSSEFRRPFHNHLSVQEKWLYEKQLQDQNMDIVVMFPWSSTKKRKETSRRELSQAFRSLKRGSVRLSVSVPR